MNYFYDETGLGHYKVEGGYTSSPPHVDYVIKGGDGYTYDPSKDIVIVHNKNRIYIPSTDFNESQAFWYNNYTELMTTGFADEYEAIGNDSVDYSGAAMVNQDLAPWDFIIFSPSGSSFTSGVYRFLTTDTSVVRPGGSDSRYAGGGALYQTTRTPITLENPELISSASYNSGYIGVSPPSDRVAAWSARLNINGTLNFSNFPDENDPEGGFDDTGLQYHSASTTISTFDVNDSELDPFYSSIGTLSCAHPSSPVSTLGVTSYSSSNFTPHGSKITVRGKDSGGNTIATDEKRIEIL